MACGRRPGHSGFNRACQGLPGHACASRLGCQPGKRLSQFGYCLRGSRTATTFPRKSKSSGLGHEGEGVATRSACRRKLDSEQGMGKDGSSLAILRWPAPAPPLVLAATWKGVEPRATERRDHPPAAASSRCLLSLPFRFRTQPNKVVQEQESKRTQNGDPVQTAERQPASKTPSERDPHAL